MLQIKREATALLKNLPDYNQAQLKDEITISNKLLIGVWALQTLNQFINLKLVKHLNAMFF